MKNEFCKPDCKYLKSASNQFGYPTCLTSSIFEPICGLANKNNIYELVIKPRIKKELNVYPNVEFLYE